DSATSLPDVRNEVIKINLRDSVDQTYTGNDRTSRIALIINIWNIYKHFSLFDDPKFSWDMLLETYLQKAALAKDKTEFLSVLQKFVVETNDEQSRVWMLEDTTEYSIPLFWKFIDNKLVVTQLVDTTLNIGKGDILLSINNESVQDLIYEKAKIYCGVSESLKILKAVTSFRIGPKNTTVVLKIKKADGKTLDITLNRSVPITEMYEKKYSPFFEIQKGIFYLDLTNFDDKLMREAIKVYEKADAIIYDARGMTAVGDFFLGMFASAYMKSVEMRIPVFTKPDHKQISYRTIPKVISPKNPFLKSKIVFLTDGRTAGLAEGLVAITQNYKLGEIIGSPTSGMLTDVLGANIPGEYRFTLSAVFGILPNGDIANRKVINPTIPAPYTIKGVIEGKDEPLEKAIEFLTK
ncbi:MAG: S41 family peptidase, partial [Bacteroidota bacterium]